MRCRVGFWRLHVGFSTLVAGVAAPMVAVLMVRWCYGVVLVLVLLVLVVVVVLPERSVA